MQIDCSRPDAAQFKTAFEEAQTSNATLSGDAPTPDAAEEKGEEDAKPADEEKEEATEEKKEEKKD
jgi:Ran-binding protein 1